MSGLVPVNLTVRAVIWQGARLLLIQRSNNDKTDPGLWEFPGGKVESAELPKEVLVREVQEELGVRVIPYHQPNFVNCQILDQRSSYPDHLHISLFYDCRLVEKSELIRLSSEHQAWEWLTPDEALKLPLKKGTKLWLELYKRGST